MDRVVRYDCTSLELSQTQMNCLRVLAALKPDKIILLSRCCGRPLVVVGGAGTSVNVVRVYRLYHRQCGTSVPLVPRSMWYACTMVSVVRVYCLYHGRCGPRVPLVPRSMWYEGTACTTVNVVRGYRLYHGQCGTSVPFVQRSMWYEGTDCTTVNVVRVYRLYHVSCICIHCTDVSVYMYTLIYIWVYIHWINPLD